MKNIFLAISSFLVLSNISAQSTFNVFEDGVFYDGYANLVSEPTPPNVLRLKNDVLTTKLTDGLLAQIGNQLTINVTITALCDNYDRIGGVNLVMVPKGSTDYNTSTASKIEVGRFITPFMNKNISPKSVPYTFVVDNLCNILKSTELTSTFDFWLELEVFGVPYAANNEVAGCSGRNDVFKGAVDFVTNAPTGGFQAATVVKPVSFRFYINDYQAGASDEIGKTKKTVTITTDQELKDANLYLITSNHGANQGGEEYIRRVHNITFDGANVLTYTPGGKSCEPYRKFNTQANGIYGPSPRTEAQWLSFSNWCPGDVIPIRTISLGTLAAGTHTFVISVPNAVFAGNEGYFPFSLYLQGNKSGLGLNGGELHSLNVYPNPAKDKITVEGSSSVVSLKLLNPAGQEILNTYESTINVAALAAGIYLIRAEFEDGSIATKNFIKD